jgi:hypothetical protein
MIQVDLPIFIVVLLAKMHTLKSDKGMHKRKGYYGLEFLIWFASPHGVVLCRWLVGVTLSMNKVCTLLLKWWLTFLAASPL